MKHSIYVIISRFNLPYLNIDKIMDEYSPLHYIHVNDYVCMYVCVYGQQPLVANRA